MVIKISTLTKSRQELLDEISFEPRLPWNWEELYNVSEPIPEVDWYAQKIVGYYYEFTKK